MSINQFKLKDLIMEGWLDFLKKKRSTGPYKNPYLSREKYTDVNKWIADNLDDNNKYIGIILYNDYFPLWPGDYVPTGQEKFAMQGWNDALELKKRQILLGIRNTKNPTNTPGWLTT